MTPAERSLETLNASLAEIRETLEARRLQTDILSELAKVIFPTLSQYPSTKGNFQSALRSRSAPPDSLFRGLFVVTLSSFEGFIKALVSALVQSRASSVTKFSDLPESFQNQYLSRSAQVLSYIGSGAVQGIPYNFAGIRDGLAKCLGDNQSPLLNPEVYTILMGNPRWSKLESIFQALGIETPFDQAFGSTAELRSWAKAAWRKNLSDAEEKLDEIISKRNLIVHVSSPVTVVESDIVDACRFFEAFAGALAIELPRRL